MQAITPSGAGSLNTAYSYDANGSIVSGAGRTVTWTAANMAAQMTQGAATVAYGPDHARIKQATGSATTYYLGGVEKVVGAGGKFVSADPIVQDMRDGVISRPFPLVRFNVTLTALTSGTGAMGDGNSKDIGLPSP